jgi:hypothetical protein
MPRKRWLSRLSHYSVSKPEGSDDADLVLVRTVLDKFEDVAALPSEVREQFALDLVTAIRFARAGVKAGQRHVSDRRIGRHILLADIARAMTQAGLAATRWSKHDLGEGESLYFEVAHALAAVTGLQLPRTLKEPAAQAMQIQYGDMSAAMRAAQDAELKAHEHRPPGRHLTIVAGTDHPSSVWGCTSVTPPRTCAELASTYPSFPF